MAPIELAEHTVLLLPFTPSLLRDPSPLFPLILDLLPRSSTASFTVLFYTPLNQGEQLYTVLRRSPRESFAELQAFLGGVYAALVTAQWKCGGVLLDVEVHFEGEDGDVKGKVYRGEDGARPQVIGLEGVSPSELVSSLFPSPTLLPSIILLEPGIYTPPSPPTPAPAVSALGGTFDHLHAAHKLLLHLGLFLAGQRLIVGLMADNLLGSKSNAELVQKLDERMAVTEAFLRRVGGVSPNPAGDAGTDDAGSAGVELAVGEIHDALGPTRDDPNIHALVVSRETLSGGAYVNRIRRETGLNELEMFVVDVIAERQEVDLRGEVDEGKLKAVKMGSTGIRKWIAEGGGKGGV
ncbi:hypothetical protein IAT38_000146 [Cryptococcus sp. DSM 104549]